MGNFIDVEPPPIEIKPMTPAELRAQQQHVAMIKQRKRDENLRTTEILLKRPATMEESDVVAAVYVALYKTETAQFFDLKHDGSVVTIGETKMPTQKNIDQIAILLKEALPDFLITIDRNKIRIAWDVT